MKDITIAVDIAKDVFEIALSHEPGVVNEQHRVTRKKLLSFFVNQQPATVVMEACGAVANKLARTVWAVWKYDTEFQSYPKAA